MRFDATYSGEESGGLSVGNDEKDVASDPTEGGGDQKEHTAEVSGGGDDEEAVLNDASADADKVDAGASGGTSWRRRSKPKKPSNARLFWIEPSLMTLELVKELVDDGLIMEYHLSTGKEELRSEEDDAIVFHDYFVAGLVILCQQFVQTILDWYRIQLQELTPNALSHLSKFIWVMVSYGRDTDIEVFPCHFMMHNQTRQIRIDGVHHYCNYSSFSFAPWHNENKGVMHHSMNKWSQSWSRNWFYTKVPGVNLTEAGEVKTVTPSLHDSFPPTPSGCQTLQGEGMEPVKTSIVTLTSTLAVRIWSKSSTLSVSVLSRTTLASETTSCRWLTLGLRGSTGPFVA